MQDNIFVGIILLISVIIFMYCYKKMDYFSENVTSKMVSALDNDIAICFDPIKNPNPRFEFIKMVDSTFVRNNLDEILDKMKGILFPAIVLMVRFVRLYSLDFICKNSSSSNNIVNLSALFFEQIKKLIKLYNQIFNMVSNIGPALYDEKVLFKQIVCLTKSKLKLNEEKKLTLEEKNKLTPEEREHFLKMLNTYNHNKNIILQNMIIEKENERLRREKQKCKCIIC
jgi:hypothetical protein